MKDRLRKIREARAKKQSGPADNQAEPVKGIRLVKPAPEPSPKPAPEPEKKPPAEQSLRERLDEFDEESWAYDLAVSEHYWQMFRGASFGGTDIQTLQNRKDEFIASSGYVELIKAELPKAEGLDRRELELRNNALLVGSVRSHPAVHRTMNVAIQAQRDFTVMVKGQRFPEPQVADLLATCGDPLMRQAVWDSQKQAMSLAPLKRMLANALNQVSTAAHGKKSYAHVLLETQDSSPEQLQSLIETFGRSTSKAVAHLKDFISKFYKLETLPLHDLGFYMGKWFSRIKGDFLPKDGKHPLEALKLTLKLMGFSPEHGGLEPDSIDKKPFTYDIGGGPGYFAEECAIRLAPGLKDFRVFINPELSPSGLDFTRTVFLESGRMIHFNALEGLQTRQAFKWDNDCMRHAIAMLFDSLLEDEKWLRDVAKVPSHESKTLSGMLRMKKLMMARRLVSYALFELKLYAGHEPAHAFAEVEEMFWGDKDPEAGKRWAWHPHLALNPGGQMSYVLGYMICNIMANDIRSRFGSLLHPEVAAHLADNYFTGYEVPWPERLKRVTGKGI
jgi:hypothetical protein